MTADDATTRVVTTSETDLGPGERLREAREAAQLSVGEVASRLRLEARVIERLESDDYDQLHGPTFVRGYLSGYARLLDLPDGPILEAYERHGFGPPALVSELGRKPEVHVSDFPVRMVTYVIAALLVVLVVLWWQSRQLDGVPTERAAVDTGTAAVTTAPTTLPVDTPAPSVPAQAVDGSERGTDAEPLEAPQASAEQSQPSSARGSDDGPVEPLQSAADATTDGAAPTTMVASANTDEGGDTREPAAAAPAVTTGDAAPTSDAGSEAMQVVVEPGAADPSETQTSPLTTAAIAEEDTGAAGGEEQSTESVPAPRPEPLPGSDVLAIQLSRESWIEIYDRGGGRLYYSLAREGSEVVVQGAGPMRVLLGEVQGAHVAYNGEPYDLSRFKGRSVVRFTVGELSDAATPDTPTPVTEEPAPGETQEPTAEGRDQSVAAATDTVRVSAATSAAAPTTPAVESAPLPARPTEPTESEAPVERVRPDS